MKFSPAVLFKAVKDMFIVYDSYKTNGERISHEMVFNALMLVSAALVGFGVISTGFEEQEAMAIGTGIYAILNMFNRVRSPGGEVKLRVEVKSKLQKSEPSILDGDD